MTQVYIHSIWTHGDPIFNQFLMIFHDLWKMCFLSFDWPLNFFALIIFPLELDLEAN